MAKINLDDSSTNLNLLVINDNFRKIEEAFNSDVLYRRNPPGEPNEVMNPLDMNGNRIYNLPTPVAEGEAFRKQDADNMLEYILLNITGPKGDKGDKGDPGIIITTSEPEILLGWEGPLTAINKLGRVKIKGALTSLATTIPINSVLCTLNIDFRPTVPYYLDIWYQGGSSGLGVVVGRVNPSGTIEILEEIVNASVLNITGDWDID